jgi:hypothetical protein
MEFSTLFFLILLGFPFMKTFTVNVDTEYDTLEKPEFTSGIELTVSNCHHLSIGNKKIIAAPEVVSKDYILDVDVGNDEVGGLRFVQPTLSNSILVLVRPKYNSTKAISIKSNVTKVADGGSELVVPQLLIMHPGDEIALFHLHRPYRLFGDAPLERKGEYIVDYTGSTLRVYAKRDKVEQVTAAPTLPPQLQKVAQLLRQATSDRSGSELLLQALAYLVELSQAAQRRQDLQKPYVLQAMELANELEKHNDLEATQLCLRLALAALYALPGDSFAGLAGDRSKVMKELIRIQSARVDNLLAPSVLQESGVRS